MDEKRQFYKKVSILVIPMVIQNLINVGISSIDVIMLGRVGEKVLSGAALGSQIQFILNLFLFGVTSGAGLLSAQYYGKGDYHMIEKIFGLALRIAMTISSLFALTAAVIPEILMKIFTNDPTVIAEGIIYLRFVCLSYLFMAFTMVYLILLRSVGRVKIATIVYFCSMIVNIVVNALLIYGLGAFPKLGIAGAAIGTLIARMTETLIVLIYDHFKNPVFSFRWKILLERDKALSQDYLKYSLPVVCNELMWGMGSAAITAIMGHLGSSVVAANSVAHVMKNLATVLCFGVANATAVMIGHAIGEGRMDDAKIYGKRFLGLSIAAGFMGAVLVLLLRPVLMATMDISAQSRSFLSMMLYVMSYFVIFQAINTTLVVGVFRGGGDTKFGLLIDSTFMWCLAIGVGYLAAFVFKWNITVVYMILMCDEIFKTPVCIWRFKSYKWLHNVTREEAIE